jgi:hypothetical protein
MCCHVGALEPQNKAGGIVSVPPRIAFLVVSHQFLVALSPDSCYREIEIEELRPGGKPRRVFVWALGHRERRSVMQQSHIFRVVHERFRTSRRPGHCILIVFNNTTRIA